MIWVLCDILIVTMSCNEWWWTHSSTIIIVDTRCWGWHGVGMRKASNVWLSVFETFENYAKLSLKSNATGTGISDVPKKMLITVWCLRMYNIVYPVWAWMMQKGRRQSVSSQRDITVVSVSYDVPTRYVCVCNRHHFKCTVYTLYTWQVACSIAIYTENNVERQDMVLCPK